MKEPSGSPVLSHERPTHVLVRCEAWHDMRAATRRDLTVLAGGLLRSAAA